MEPKVNDILDVFLWINDEADNETKYSVTYWLDGLIYSSADVSMPKDAGYISIEDWISQDMDSFPGVSDYEIIEITEQGNCQTAKIKVKVFKE